MKQLQGDDDDAYKRQFSQYIKNGITADSIEAMYKKAHAEIKKDPAAKPNPKKGKQYPKKRWNKAPLNRAQRKDKVKQKKESFIKKLQAVAADVWKGWRVFFLVQGKKKFNVFNTSITIKK